MFFSCETDTLFLVDYHEKEVFMSNQSSAPRASKSAAAITALVLSIVAVALSLLPIINNFSFVLAIVAIVFGIVALIGIKNGKKSGMGMAVASIIVSIIAVVAVLGSQAAYSAAINDASKGLDKMTGDATEEILGTDVEIAFGTYKLSKGSYGMIESELPVKITNLSGDRASFNAQIEATDKSGNRITTDTVFVNDLGAGQSQTVKAFAYVSKDEYDAMKSAQFSIVSVSEY